MSSKWLPANGMGFCTHELEDGRVCGQPAVIAHVDYTAHLCALHVEFADPAVRLAKCQQMQEQERKLDDLYGEEKGQ